jgi:hypothetical protein
VDSRSSGEFIHFSTCKIRFANINPEGTHGEEGKEGCEGEKGEEGPREKVG